MKPDDDVITAAEKMISHQIDSLPVVNTTPDGNMEVVGRITKTTITRVFLDFFQRN